MAALAGVLGKLDRRPWTLVEFSEADWGTGYCAGERKGAWRSAGGKVRKAKVPRMLKVPCAQFCIGGNRVLVERSLAERSGLGAIYEIEGEALREVEVKWRH